MSNPGFKPVIVLLNTAVFTSYGMFHHFEISEDEARLLVQQAIEEDDFLSAIGHKSTAELLSEVLEVPIQANRIQYAQSENDKAIVFKLKGRPAEGKVLSIEEMRNIGYDFGMIIKCGETA